MGRKHLNPWPSVADLFSALTVTAFAALIMVGVGAVKLKEPERIERDAADSLARIFKEQYEKSTADHQVTSAPCTNIDPKARSGDMCLQIPFRFRVNSDELGDNPADHTAVVKQVQAACKIYSNAVEVVLKEMDRKYPHAKIERSDISLLIEGHTDKTLPSKELSERKQFLYNWDLSSRRAASVLYEFRLCGVSPDTEYSISSVGFAATRRVCKESNPKNPKELEECNKQNRRTTLHIKVELYKEK